MNENNDKVQNVQVQEKQHLTEHSEDIQTEVVNKYSINKKWWI